MLALRVMRLLRVVCGVVVVAAAAAPAAAQRIALDAVATGDSALRHEVRLRDGSRLIGRVVAVAADSVQVRLQSGVIALARADVTQVRQFTAAQLRNGEFWPENPNATRLLFSSTAFPLAPREGYYWNAWLFLHGFAVGVTERLTLGGGLTLLPGVSLDENLFFITPKLTLTQGPGGGTAIGALAGFLPGAADSDDTSLGILYGVGTAGSRESSASFGVGWGYVGGKLADRPVVMLGGTSRMTRRVSFITENWFIPDDGKYPGLLSYGFRIIGDKLSVDLAFVNFTEEMFFPGVPWVGFAVKF